MYDPNRPLTHIDDIRDDIILDIDRRPDDEGADWRDNFQLIENVLRRDSEVTYSIFDLDGQTIFVALKGDFYDIEDLEVIDTRLRQLIGRVATFDFKS